MGEPQNQHFYDLGIFARVPDPPNQLSLFLETPEYLKNKEKPLGSFNKYYVINLEILETYLFDNFRKGGHRKMKIRLTKSWKSWMWDQYLPENMKLKFGKLLV